VQRAFDSYAFADLVGSSSIFFRRSYRNSFLGFTSQRRILRLGSSDENVAALNRLFRDVVVETINVGGTLRTSYRALIELSTLAYYVPPARGEILAFVTLCKKVVGCDVYQRYAWRYD